MITKKAIDELYKRYRKLPPGIEHLDIGLLFEYASEHHDIEIDENGNLVINSFPDDSPFRKIELNRIHGFSKFEETLAIILHSSIIFLNKNDNGANIHIKNNPTSLWGRVQWWLGKN